MINTWAVYVATNLVNSKQYVGITKNIDRRWKQHQAANGSAPAFHAAIKKYGKDNFVFSHIADAFDFESACLIEKQLIISKNTKAPYGYNLTDGGEGVIGVKLTEKQINQKRASTIKFISSLSELERKEKYSSFAGKTHTEETKEKIRQANIGKNKGKFASKETKEKISAAQKKVVRRPLSDEIKEKIRLSLTGRKMPKEEKHKHRSFLGKKHSEETKAKIRASNIATKALNKAKKMSEKDVIS